MKIPDFYKVLGVAKTASADQIKAVFRKLARQHHPDRAHDKQAAEEKFKEINQAYEVLGDPDNRREYDNYCRRSQQHSSTARETSVTPRPASSGGGFTVEYLDELIARQRKRQGQPAQTPTMRYREPEPEPFTPQPPRKYKPPIRTPLDVLAFLLRPFGWFGGGLLMFIMVGAKVAFFALILTLPSAAIGFVLAATEVIPLWVAEWSWAAAKFNLEAPLVLLGLALVPLAWLFQFMMDYPKVFLLAGAALVMLASVALFLRLVFGPGLLRRMNLTGRSEYWRQHVGLHTAYGFFYITATTLGFWIYRGLPPDFR